MNALNILHIPPMTPDFDRSEPSAATGEGGLSLGLR